MIEEADIRILDILSRRLVAKPAEIRSALGGSDGVAGSLQKLLSMDCVKTVEPIGEKCYVITQKGTKILKESGISTGARPQQQTIATS
jgi:hypothetical protein